MGVGGNEQLGNSDEQVGIARTDLLPALGESEGAP